jgi:hypothetical protein
MSAGAVAADRKLRLFNDRLLTLALDRLTLAPDQRHTD